MATDRCGRGTRLAGPRPWRRSTRPNWNPYHRLRQPTLERGIDRGAGCFERIALEHAVAWLVDGSDESASAEVVPEASEVADPETAATKLLGRANERADRVRMER